MIEEIRCSGEIVQADQCGRISISPKLGEERLALDQVAETGQIDDDGIHVCD